MTAAHLAPLMQAAAALVLALSFAVAGTQRSRAMAGLCGVQAGLVAIGAWAQLHPWVALAEAVEAAALLSPLRLWPAAGWFIVDARRPSRPMAVPIALGALLALLALTLGPGGLPAATVLLGLLVIAARRAPEQQALGAMAAQSGLVMAALTVGVTPAAVAIVAIPVLPVLLLGGLWIEANRTRLPRSLTAAHARWVDRALCSLGLLLACILPWQIGRHGSVWLLDARAAHVALLLAALAAAASWTAAVRPSWGCRAAILAGTALAVLVTPPVLSWLGMALATAGAAADALPYRSEAWRRLRLGCTALALALLGTVGLAAAAPALPAAAFVILGYGALAVLAPELTIAAAAQVLRLRGVAPDGLLLAFGLAAVLIAAVGMSATARGQRRMLPLAGLAHGGAAVFAFGLGGAGDLAGVLQLTLLALTQCALLLASTDGLDRVASLAGLAAVPPCGVFPALALVLAATASRQPWLLLPLGAGLAGVVWPMLRQLPPGRRLHASPAWVPLALALLLGFAMPDPVLAWFRLAAR